VRTLAHAGFDLARDSRRLRNRRGRTRDPDQALRDAAIEREPSPVPAV
jgi:hypothetical protein